MNIIEIENILERVYLDVLQWQLNNIDPILSEIKKTSNYAWGKEILQPIYDDKTSSTLILKSAIKSIKMDVEFPKSITEINNARTLVDTVNDKLQDALSKCTKDVENAFYTENTPISDAIEGGEETLDLSGLKELFSDNETLYSIDREKYHFKPLYFDFNKETLFDDIITNIIENEEIWTNSNTCIVCSYQTLQAYKEYCKAHNKEIKTRDFEKLAYTLFEEKFIIVTPPHFYNDKIYIINTESILLNQLCDWRWLEDENGDILRETESGFNATLIKYCDFTCSTPQKQYCINIHNNE